VQLFFVGVPEVWIVVALQPPPPDAFYCKGERYFGKRNAKAPLVLNLT
jgi:hypothetical protein